MKEENMINRLFNLGAVNNHNHSEEMILQEAINALNELTKYYQETDSNETSIQLEHAWAKHKLFGSENNDGILGIVVLKSSHSGLYQHPFKKKLEEMGIRAPSFSDRQTKNVYEFRGVFSLYGIEQIAKIPEKCQLAMNEKRESVSDVIMTNQRK